MKTLTKRRAALQDLLRFDMRASDVDELQAFNDKNAYETLADSILRSRECWVVLDEDGAIVAFYGIGAISSSTACPWMVASPLINQYPLQSVRMAKQFIRENLKRYYTLRNYTATDNPKNLQWLRLLGASELAPRPMGPLGRLYTEFYFHRET